MNDASLQIDTDEKRRRSVLHNILLLIFGGASVVVACMPLALYEGVSLLGGLPLIAIYCWTLRRPEEVRPVTIFFLGLLQDFISGGTIGIWAFLYLTLYTVLLTQQGGFLLRSALFSWLGFLLVAFWFVIFTRFVGWVVVGTELSSVGLALQWGVSALLYPLTLWRHPRPLAA